MLCSRCSESSEVGIVSIVNYQPFQVQVVREKSTGEVYAMKVMKKAHILQQTDVSILRVHVKSTSAVLVQYCNILLLCGLNLTLPQLWEVITAK